MESTSIPKGLTGQKNMQEFYWKGTKVSQYLENGTIHTEQTLYRKLPSYAKNGSEELRRELRQLEKGSPTCIIRIVVNFGDSIIINGKDNKKFGYIRIIATYNGFVEVSRLKDIQEISRKMTGILKKYKK